MLLTTITPRVSKLLDLAPSIIGQAMGVVCTRTVAGHIIK